MLDNLATSLADTLEGIPVLSLLIIIPLIGALAAFFFGKKSAKLAKSLALAFSFVALVLSALVLIAYYGSSNGGFMFSENYVWVEQLGINYNLAIDGLSLPMVFLSTLLVFLATLFSWDVSEKTRTYMSLMLVLEVGVLGVFMSLDYFLFYIFWEIVLIPMFFLISIWGGPNKSYASIKFLIYTHVASLVMLLGIFALYFTAAGDLGYYTFDMAQIASVSGSLESSMRTLIFAALFFGFIVKMPMVPFHTWLPDAHVPAPTAGSVLLAGILLKMGAYGIIRVCLPIFPVDVSYEIFGVVINWQMILAAIGVVSMVYGAFACLAQTDLKKMVAYSSISHMGIVMLGIATLSELGIAAAIFQMFAHGIIAAVLFMVCGMFQHKAGTREIPLLGGLVTKMPIVSVIMMFSFMASLGLPGLAGFVAEFSVFTATFDWLGTNYWYWIIIPLMTVALTAAYYLWAMQRTIFGELTTKIRTDNIRDAHWFEVAPIVVLLLLIVLLGVWPSALMDVITPTLPFLSIPGVI